MQLALPIPRIRNLPGHNTGVPVRPIVQLVKPAVAANIATKMVVFAACVKVATAGKATILNLRRENIAIDRPGNQMQALHNALQQQKKERNAPGEQATMDIAGSMGGKKI